jgi:predicted phosphodiesterase
VKLWIWSDLHLELQTIYMPLGHQKPDGVDAIICAGDLCHADRVADTAKAFIELYDVPMVFVPGNHEFCRGPFGKDRNVEGDRLLLQIAQWDSKDWAHWFHVLDDDAVEISGVRFVGGTLWTDFLLGAQESDLPWRLNSAVTQIADFSQIGMRDGSKLSPQAMVNMHRETVDFLRRELATPFPGKTVVVTHHLPHPAATPAIYRGANANFLFASSERAFGDVFESDEAPVLWVCGHTHHPSDVVVGRTRIVCNPRGYQSIPNERENGFRWDLVIDTETLP